MVNAQVVFLLAGGVVLSTGLCARPLMASDDNDGGTGGPPPVVNTSPFIKSMIEPVPKPGEPWLQPGMEHGVNWTGLLAQSSLFLGIQHGFRLATEPGTREGLKGPFLSGYLNSVGNLHGWADGDVFYVNYVGHPMQGAVTGFIWVQNDRSYRMAEIGRNSLYWKSRLRAAAFSYLYSVQFEIGPLSEASIGKIQGEFPQQGFVDHVITPIVGTGWLLTEDFLDQYVIKRAERSGASPWLLVLLRGGLNPSRSFANLMRFKVPWARDTRPGVYSGRLKPFLNAQKSGLIQAPKRPKPELEGPFGVASFEFAMNARPELYLHDGGATTCLGGGGEAAFRLDQSWQFVLAVNGCKLRGMEKNWSGDSLSYMAGPRWTPNSGGRWSPFAQVLLGGQKIWTERYMPELETALIAAAKEQNKPLPTHDQYTTQVESNALALAMGGGVDLRVNPALAFRIANLEYKHAWGPSSSRFDYNNGLSMTMSLVLRMGTW